MSNLKEYFEDKAANRFGWIFLIAVVALLITVDVIKWDRDFFYSNNYHAYFIGFITWLVYSVRNQSIVDNNLFFKYSMIAIVPIAAASFKMLITSFSIGALLAVSFPLIYLAFLRFLILIFFPSYPVANNIILISYTKTGTYWKGKEQGIVPSNRDKRLSLWLDIISYSVMFLILFFAWFL